MQCVHGFFISLATFYSIILLLIYFPKINLLENVCQKYSSVTRTYVRAYSVKK